jgi:hypothetical protein
MISVPAKAEQPPAAQSAGATVQLEAHTLSQVRRQDSARHVAGSPSSLAV